MAAWGCVGAHLVRLLLFRFWTPAGSRGVCSWRALHRWRAHPALGSARLPSEHSRPHLWQQVWQGPLDTSPVRASGLHLCPPRGLLGKRDSQVTMQPRIVRGGASRSRPGLAPGSVPATGWARRLWRASPRGHAQLSSSPRPTAPMAALLTLPPPLRCLPPSLPRASPRTALPDAAHGSGVCGRQLSQRPARGV